MMPQNRDPNGPMPGQRQFQESKWRIAAHSPLGFFVLALLIVEAFIFGAGAWFGLSELIKILALGVGILLFIMVFVTVVVLVIKFPKNLVFGEGSHFRVHEMEYWGSKGQPHGSNPQLPKTNEVGETVRIGTDSTVIEMDDGDEGVR